RITLRNSRRMHPGISYISSHLFCNDSLKPAVTAEERMAPVHMSGPDRPLLLVNVNGREKVAPSGSRYNDEETAVARRLALHLQKRTSSILVLAYYKDHVARFKASFPTVEVYTIDSSQGTERDVIILMTTKTMHSSAALIADPRRTNVALTRARRMLLIIGLKPTLQKVDIWTR
ncbi:hypothetical protein PENTCL1PPCAC_19381, partial [Pristionchus entomophagus]